MKWRGVIGVFGTETYANTGRFLHAENFPSHFLMWLCKDSSVRKAMFTHISSSLARIIASSDVMVRARALLIRERR
jgi:hypothetical protein